jgi:hypothetical protein
VALPLPDIDSRRIDVRKAGVTPAFLLGPGLTLASYGLLRALEAIQK